jgi:ankyrin repeat protein
MFEAVKSGGMPALMKMMNDKTFLSKIGEKMADVIPSDATAATGAIPPTAAATAAGIPSQQQPLEIANILDAAKYGDIEAIEDFVAIGKTDDVDDSERNALHYAVGFNQAEAVQILLDNKMDVNATDKHGNTALHFAAGYAREDIATMLLRAGADGRVENSEGDSPLGMIRKEPRNPLNGSKEFLKVMEGSVPVSAL